LQTKNKLTTNDQYPLLNGATDALMYCGSLFRVIVLSNCRPGTSFTGV